MRMISTKWTWLLSNISKIGAWPMSLLLWKKRRPRRKDPTWWLNMPVIRSTGFQVVSRTSNRFLSCTKCSSRIKIMKGRSFSMRRLPNLAKSSRSARGKKEFQPTLPCWGHSTHLSFNRRVRYFRLLLTACSNCITSKMEMRSRMLISSGRPLRTIDSSWISTTRFSGPRASVTERNCLVRPSWRSTGTSSYSPRLRIICPVLLKFCSLCGSTPYKYLQS